MPPRYRKWKFYPMRILLISLTIVCLCACSFPGVYKINVEQGNIVTQEMVDQLKPGMNRRQVRFILGTPLVEDTFNQNRWDYLYVKRNGEKVLSESRLTVEFEGDALVSDFGRHGSSRLGRGKQFSTCEPAAGRTCSRYTDQPIANQARSVGFALLPALLGAHRSGFAHFLGIGNERPIDFYPVPIAQHLPRCDYMAEYTQCGVIQVHAFKLAGDAGALCCLQSSCPDRQFDFE